MRIRWLVASGVSWLLLLLFFFWYLRLFRFRVFIDFCPFFHCLSRKEDKIFEYFFIHNVPVFIVVLTVDLFMLGRRLFFSHLGQVSGVANYTLYLSLSHLCWRCIYYAIFLVVSQGFVRVISVPSSNYRRFPTNCWQVVLSTELVFILFGGPLNGDMLQSVNNYWGYVSLFSHLMPLVKGDKLRRDFVIALQLVVCGWLACFVIK